MFVGHIVLNVGYSAAFYGLREIHWPLAVIVATMWAFDQLGRRAAHLPVPDLP